MHAESILLNEIHPTNTSTSYPSHYTHDQAHHLLLKEAFQLVQERKTHLIKQVATWKYLFKPDNVIILLLAIGTFVYSIITKITFSSLQIQSRATGALVGSVLIFIALAWNTFLYKRESRSTLLEMVQRLELILDKIESHGINYKQVLIFSNLDFMELFRILKFHILYLLYLYQESFVVIPFCIFLLI